MSLKITNRLTTNQRSILRQLDYYGTYDLTINEAGQLIDELFIQKSQENKNWEYKDMPEELKIIRNEEL